ncbi:MAG: hypothetical protein E6J34_02020 [Chloroflexi bacterium]|nr:MAG: hypothetical protein E6J34_02020 [Chloroflexota bacterium]
MQHDLFQQPVSHDFAVQGSHCEWCGKQAVQHLTALGGPHHNQSGNFCLSCATAFIRRVHSHIASPVASGMQASRELDSFCLLASDQKNLQLVNELPVKEILAGCNQSLLFRCLN